MLFFFGLLSLLHIPQSSYLHKMAKQRLNDAHLEKEYVRKQLENLQTYMLKKRHSPKRDNPIEKEKFKKIELRGTDLSPKKNRPFSRNEMRFNVIEQ